LVGDVRNIIVIESLIDERLTGRELYDDIISSKIETGHKPITHKFYSVSTKTELIDVIKYYEFNASGLNGGILIHLEMHGAKDKTGLILSEKSLITWKELVDLFRPINIVTCDKLFLTMATCYGRNLYKGVDPYKKSPYSGYISASKAIYPSEIVAKYSILFEQLIDLGNLVAAYLKMEETESNFYYKDSKRTFEDSFQSYTDELMNNPEKKAKFIEDSIKEVKQAGQPTPDDKMVDSVLKQVLGDLYVKQKEAFNFSDCD